MGEHHAARPKTVAQIADDLPGYQARATEAHRVFTAMLDAAVATNPGDQAAIKSGLLVALVEFHVKWFMPAPRVFDAPDVFEELSTDLSKIIPRIVRKTPLDNGASDT